MTTERIYWIDWSKCILIYLVVLAHYGGIPTFVDNWICAFHMPAFFMISGYLHKERSVSVSFPKNVKRLLVPALLFSLICWMHTLTVDRIKHVPLTVEEHIWKPFLGLIRYDRPNAMPQCGVIWFIEVLFICKLVIDFLGRDKSYRLLYFAITVCVVFTSIIYRNGLDDRGWTFLLQRTLASFPFVALGYIAKERGWMKRLDLIKWLPVIATVFYIIGVLANGRVGIATWRFGHSVFLYYSIALLGCLSFFLLISKYFLGGGFTYSNIKRNDSNPLPT